MDRLHFKLLAMLAILLTIVVCVAVISEDLEVNADTQEGYGATSTSPRIEIRSIDDYTQPVDMLIVGESYYAVLIFEPTSEDDYSFVNGTSGATWDQNNFEVGNFRYSQFTIVGSSVFLRGYYTLDGVGSSVSDTFEAASYTHTLYFDANGGRGAPQSLTYTGSVPTYSHEFTIPSTIPRYTGWIFREWDGIYTYQQNLEPGDTIEVDYQATVYAIWTKSVTLSYDANGGSSAPSSQSTTLIINRNGNIPSANFTVSSVEPTRDGFEFIGWSINSDDVDPMYVAGNSVITTNSVRLYAIWNVPDVTISFDSMGGSSVDSITVNAGMVPEAPVEPTLEYFVFKGWYTSTSFTTEYTFSEPVNEDITLYAKWEGILAFTSSPVADAQFLSINEQTFVFSAAQSIGNTTVLWDFGDGSTSTNTYVSHTFDEPGSYIVTLTVYNAYGSSTDTIEITVDGNDESSTLWIVVAIIAVAVVAAIVLRHIL